MKDTSKGLMSGRHTIFYDGDCGLCDRFTQLVLRHDQADRFRFAPLQGGYARRVLAEHGVELVAGAPLETVYVLTDEGRLLDRAEAALFVFGQMPSTRGLARAGRLFPRPLRALGYRALAKSRYALFGRSDRCALPSAETADKFIKEPSA